MKQEPIFSAVVGNRWLLGFFDIYPDQSCVWQYGKKKITGRANIGTLEKCLRLAEAEGKKYIAGAHVQEYYWNPRATNSASIV